jgi:hypothetical protein
MKLIATLPVEAECNPNSRALAICTGFRVLLDQRSPVISSSSPGRSVSSGHEHCDLERCWPAGECFLPASSGSAPRPAHRVSRHSIRSAIGVGLSSSRRRHRSRVSASAAARRCRTQWDCSAGRLLPLSPLKSMIAGTGPSASPSSVMIGARRSISA